MKFTKMQANGNDYVYTDVFETPLIDPASAAIRWCNRHFGIGGDGLVLICPSDTCDFRMRIFDPDGTEAEVCGNALQCSAVLYSLSRKLRKKRVSVETLAGKRYVYTEWKGDSLQEVSVDLGAPEVEFFDRIIHVDGEDFPAVSVSFGNPHCVVMARELSDEYFLKYGSMLENHPLFPHRTNVEFVQVVDRCHIRMRTWERGCGETLSCASGSGAATVAAKLWGVCENEIMVEQKGGSIRCVWNERTDCVRAYSKAVVVFEGTTEETE
jgi:diaminopimelate epimerase